MLLIFCLVVWDCVILCYCDDDFVWFFEWVVGMCG